MFIISLARMLTVIDISLANKSSEAGLFACELEINGRSDVEVG